MLLPQTLQIRTHIIMENAIWFMILGGLSLLLLIYTFWKRRDAKLFILFFGLGAAAGFFDCIIFVWLESYEYYPGILKDNYFDMVVGAFLSQVYYVSSMALLIAAFHLRFRWILVFVAMFVGIEILFLSLGIYKLNWWHPSYTAIGLLAYFWLSKRWYQKLLQVSSPWIRWFTTFCLCHITFINLVAISLINKRYHFNGGWFDNATRDTIAVVVVIMLIKSLVISLVCYYRLHRIIIGLLLILMWACYPLLTQLNIMSYKNGWDLIYLALTDIVVLLCCYYSDQVLSRSSNFKV